MDSAASADDIHAMAVPHFDTLRERGHFTSEQAETLTEALAEATQDNLPTKADLHETASRLGAEIRETQSRLKAEISATRTSLRETEGASTPRSRRSSFGSRKNWKPSNPTFSNG